MIHQSWEFGEAISPLFAENVTIQSYITLGKFVDELLTIELSIP